MSTDKDGTQVEENYIAGIKIDEVECSACVLCLGTAVEDNGAASGRVSLCADHIEKMRAAIEEINEERRSSITSEEQRG